MHRRGGVIMGHCVRLVIPTDNEARIVPIIRKIIGRWGGCTITSGKGWWTDKCRGQIFDRLSVVDCSVPNWDKYTRQWWEDIAIEVCDRFRQDCVFLSVHKESTMLVNRDGMVRIGSAGDV